MKRFVLLATVSLLIFGCSSGGDDSAVDAGPGDSGGERDAGPPKGLCPRFAAAECMAQEPCGEELPRQSNCAGCFSYNRSICNFGSCESPETLEVTNTHTVSFAVGTLEMSLNSFAAAAVSAVTAGGETVTCEQVYDGTADLTDACYNVVDSRGLDISQVAQTYTIPFSRFPAGMRTLFVIWGYELEGAEGEPAGISCTEFDVGSPMGMGVGIEGDMMRPIQ